MKRSFISLASLVAITALSSCSPTGGRTMPTYPTGTSGDISSTTQEQTSSTSGTKTTITTNTSGTTKTTVTSATPTTTKTTTATSEIDPSDYYKNISASATGDTLKSALYNLIKGHNTSNTSYDTLEQAMRITDRNWDLSPDENDTNPYMNLLYMVNNDTTPHLWNTYHGSGGMIDNAHWDKEHMWVKSNGFNTKSLPAYFDLHHLRASDMKNNNTRSNLPYGPVSSGTTVKDYDGNASGLKTSAIYQPLARDRGDCARAIMYMATRYSTGDGSGGTKLTLTDGTDSSGGKFGYLSTLLKWNLEDPPDEWEKNRNNIIYEKYQNNRNPFIDHPEYACRIWQGTSSATANACK